MFLSDFKKKVHKNFSYASTDYDDYTEIQKKVAQETFLYISKKKYSNILELGAGTGHLTQLLIKNLQFNNLFVNDISYKMLEILGEKIKESKNVFKLVFDCEVLPFKKEPFFDLIVSSSTFQWLENYEKFFDNIYSVLKKEGDFIFSMFGENTFIELEKLREELGLNHSFRKHIISFNTLEKIIKKAGFAIEKSFNTYYTCSFNSFREFALVQKKSGAFNKNGSILSKSDYKKISPLLLKPITLTYNIYYFKLKK